MCAMISGLFIGNNDGRPPQAYKENLVSLSTPSNSLVAVLLWLSVACFVVRVSVTFHLMCVHITCIIVRFGFLSGHLLGKSCSLG